MVGFDPAGRTGCRDEMHEVVGSVSSQAGGKREEETDDARAC